MANDVFSPKERLVRVLSGEKVERPPIICPGGMMNAAIVDVMNKNNHVLPDAHHTADKMTDLAYDVHQYTGFENFGIPFCMTVEAEVLGSEINYPYTPVLYGGCYDSAKENGIHISPFGLVYYPPIISAYVGPDITSGVLSTRLEKQKGTTLLIDIGTNGEMVIARDGALSATSTAAGPAFEGMNITFGMRAGKGAIEYFEVHDNNEIEIRTIGNCPATGICGSGLFDIVGELIRVGIIKKNGRFIDPSKLDDDNPLKEHLSEYEGKLAFEITSGVYLTLSDVRQVQLAKGAVRSGVEALMLSQNVDASQVDKVLIAGSFGYHLRAKSLVNMGLIPATFQDKIDFVGNTSKTGGNAFLLNQDFRTEMKDLVSKINCVELANIENFNNLFVKCLNF